LIARRRDDDEHLGRALPTELAVEVGATPWRVRLFAHGRIKRGYQAAVESDASLKTAEIGRFMSAILTMITSLSAARSHSAVAFNFESLLKHQR
jgi:hypothetical protein